MSEEAKLSTIVRKMLKIIKFYDNCVHIPKSIKNILALKSK